MGKAAVHLVYTSDAGSKFTAGVLTDPSCLQEISQKIIKEKKREVSEIAGDDPVLGEIKAEEVTRLIRVLKTIVPGLG